MNRNTAMKLVLDELDRVLENHDTWVGPHMGYAIILEELDELWDEVKADNGTSHRGATEAVQVAATALRYLIDLCDDGTVADHEEKIKEHEYRYRPSFPHGGFAGSYSG